jgi:hypothetical protein
MAVKENKIIVGIYKIISLFLVVALLGMSVWMLFGPPAVERQAMKVCLENNISWAVFEETIDHCEDADRKIIDRAVAELNLYFDQMHSRIDILLNELFGVTSKVKMLWYLSTGQNSRLQGFVENSFDECLGSSDEIRKEIALQLSDVSQELNANNERLALEIGALVEVGFECRVATDGEDESEQHFRDLARQMSSSIIIHRAGIQLGVETAIMAVNYGAVPPLTTIVAGLLTDTGIIAAGSSAGPIGTILSCVIALAIDITSNHLAKEHLRPGIEQALALRRKETLACFEKALNDKLEKYQASRHRRVIQALAEFGGAAG